ncbi:MAG: hypothetical protein P4L55_09750 [Syntrophobacteraceae bacterium]|nr:hypothetical protein [Syntrophobacteraceae bacterium]
MRIRICLFLILGVLLFAFSKAEASITWTGDNFFYSAKDSGGFYFPGMLPISSSQTQSTAGGGSENSSAATATDSYTGLSMASGAWGNASQNSATDSGGATVYAYAGNTVALDNQVGVLGAGQNVSSYIDRSFTVSATGQYTLSASAIEPMYSNITSGAGYVSSPQLTGEVQVFQTDPSTGTTTLLNATTYSLASLVSSPQTLSVKLVSGDYYQLVVALSGMTAQGGQNNPPGIVTSYTNYGASGFYGNLDGSFGLGTSSNPVTLTASLSPAPIPGSVLLLLSGLGSMVILKRKRA